MAQHVEINPDNESLPFSLGLKALRSASMQKTHKTGTVRIPTSTGKDFIAGEGAEDGVNWIDGEGVQTPFVDTAAIDKAVDDIGKKAEQVRKDMQSEVDDVRARVDGLSSAGDRLSGQITDIRGTVNGQQSKLDEFGQKLEGVVTQNGATVKSVTELKQTVSGLDARVSQNTETAEGAMSKATTVQQTADGIKTTLSKDYTSTKDADKKYSTKTELSTEAGRIRADLTETTKTANGAMDKATSVEQTASSLSTKISEHATTLEATVKTANEAKSTADSNKTTISQVSTTASDALSKATSLESGLDGFKTTVAQTYQTKAGMSSYGTKSYIDETSKSVALGVVQDYKGADGSGLATKTDISVSRTEITSEVSNTYATKDGVSEEISSKITQNNSSWELKFATKTEAKSAQDAANAANAAAADAQGRVGNLEPCIRMTSDGVRVGKQANGAYQGTSALVGTDGTFDVLDSSSKRLLEVGSSGVKFPKSSDGHQLALGYVTDSTTKTDTLYIGDVVSGQQEGGPKNRLGFTGSQVSLDGGDISINANDNQLSLYGHKGANLLVPSGGNVQVGGQAGSSSTTLTLRGSTVNLSGGLVNVNGRTLNAPVDAKQSQRWDNIQLDVKCVNRVVTVNILHPLGSNAIIGDQGDQCEIGYIKEGYRPSRMIGCHLAAYNTTNLFLEINPSTGKVACFRLWGNQNTWAYFSASLSYVI